MIDPREKNLSPERLRKVRKIKKLVAEIRATKAFNDIPYAGR